jgi:hypothetical protein
LLVATLEELAILLEEELAALEELDTAGELVPEEELAALEEEEFEFTEPGAPEDEETVPPGVEELPSPPPGEL